MTKNIVKSKYLYLLLVPGIIWLVLFKYVPMYGIIIAFKDYNIFQGIGDSPWVGWVNFLDFFSYDRFWTLMKNTILISGYKIVSGFPFPIIVALMLNEVRSKAFKRSIQTIVYFPHFLSWVIVGGLVITLFSPNGLVNSFPRKQEEEILKALLSLANISEKVYLSPSHFEKIFKEVTGKSVIDYLNIIRMEKAKVLLKDSNLKIETIAEKLGYLTSKGFIRAFKKYENKTPGQYRSNLLQQKKESGMEY